MFFVKVFLVAATICCASTQADMFSSIPILGPVLGTVTNASKTVLNTAAGAIQITADQLTGRRSFIETQIINRIKELLNELRTLMFDAIPLLGLPRLEPYHHGHVDINITHEIGIFEGTMDDVVVIGFSQFIVDNVGAKINSKLPLVMDPNITIDLHYDTLDMTGLYDIKAFVGDLFNVFGKGKFDLTLRGLEIHANVLVTIEIMKKLIRIDDIDIDIKLENMTCNFENLMGGGEIGELFNGVLGELAPEAVEVLWPEIRPGVEAKVKEVANFKIIDLGYDTVLEILLPFLKPKPTTTTAKP